MARKKATKATTARSQTTTNKAGNNQSAEQTKPKTEDEQNQEAKKPKTDLQIQQEMVAKFPYADPILLRENWRRNLAALPESALKGSRPVTVHATVHPQTIALIEEFIARFWGDR